MVNSHCLVGARLTAVVAVEFWLSDELVTPCCATYFADDRGSCWKLSHNDVTEAWELDACGSIPEAGTSEGEDEFRYPAVDIGVRLGLLGLVVSSYEERDYGQIAQACIGFEDGTELRFRHWYLSDTEDYVYRALA